MSDYSAFAQANPGTDYPVKDAAMRAQLSLDSDKVDSAGLGYQFGYKRNTTAALNVGYYGGVINVAGTKTAIADGTVALTNAATNYVERTTAGVVSANTVGYTAGKIPMFRAVTAAGVVTGITDDRQSNVAGDMVVIGTLNAGSGTLQTDSFGNLGLGVTPSASSLSAGGYRELEIGSAGATIIAKSADIVISSNSYYNAAWKYGTAARSGQFNIGAGTFTWSIDSGAPGAGNVCSYTTAMALNASSQLGLSGALTVGLNASSQGQILAQFYDSGMGGNSSFYSAQGAGGNAAATALALAKNSSTNRSINAGGTINASGADYAEYERKALGCGIVEAGQIIGFDADGYIVDQWSKAFSFGVKSSAPSYVGGDVWGTETALGVKRPSEPSLKLPEYSGPAEPSLPTRDATDANLAAYAAALDAWELFQPEYQQAVALAKIDHHADLASYEIALAAFNARLEDARMKVDRIAYSGKVPVNVTGAQPSDYIIAAEGPNDTIAGAIITKAQMAADMGQMLNAVGRVRRIVDDGRAEIAVIVH